MKLEAFEESSERDKCGHLGGLVMTCPICGKEFGCNREQVGGPNHGAGRTLH